MCALGGRYTLCLPLAIDRSSMNQRWCTTTEGTARTRSHAAHRQLSSAHTTTLAPACAQARTSMRPMGRVRAHRYLPGGRCTAVSLVGDQDLCKCIGGAWISVAEADVCFVRRSLWSHLVQNLAHCLTLGARKKGATADRSKRERAERCWHVDHRSTTCTFVHRRIGEPPIASYCFAILGVRRFATNEPSSS